MSMEEYPKIQSVFLRDPMNKYRTFLEGQYSTDEFGYLAHNQWLFEEKVDGTNIRVNYKDGRVTFGGRTEQAQIPATLVNKLQELFTAETLGPLVAQAESHEYTLYGEGYGAKIQKGGGDYIATGCHFILFDVKIGRWWLRREDSRFFALALRIPYVPTIGEGTLREAAELCRKGFKSKLRDTPPEGLVCRPMIDLSDRHGNRIITKMKLKDFQ